LTFRYCYLFGSVWPAPGQAGGHAVISFRPLGACVGIICVPQGPLAPLQFVYTSDAHRNTNTSVAKQVADFGLCKSSTDSAPKSKVGSPTYMAPELFFNTLYDGRKADVFSCGVVLYQMFFGALPFNRTLDGRPLDFNRNFGEIMDNMMQENWQQLLPASATTAPPGCSPPPPPSGLLLDLLHGMLRYDPNKRLTLLEVMHHHWYREDLPDETYQLVLSGVTGEDQRPQPVSGTSGSGEETNGAHGAGWLGHSCAHSAPKPHINTQATSQSVDLIEAEFARIIHNCESCHQTAMLGPS
ncbi:hypothetical protein Vretimale_1430, partial [Volvox reticuliferus]